MLVLKNKVTLLFLAQQQAIATDLIFEFLVKDEVQVTIEVFQNDEFIFS